MEFILSKIQIVIIVLTRVSTIIFVFPFFGNRTIPIKMKIGFSLLLTILIFPLVSSQHLAEPRNLLMFVFMIGREVIVGLIIGFAASLLFMAFKLAGTIIGFQMGFSIVSVIDPQSNQQISIIGQLQYLAAILLFLAIDGHHFLLEALAQSFQVIPLNGAAFSGRLVEKFVSMSAQVFVIAIKIGLPVIIALLMTTVALGVIARTAPQMNVFIVGFPLKIGLGIFMLATSFPLLAYMFKKLMLIFKNDVITTIRLLAP